MKIHDKVYGSFDIGEPVLIELLKSKPLERLKKINQAGTQLVKPHKKVTRYDHCVGVMLLLKMYDASLEEQIAGLLHDIPHTAFSHAIDFVVGDHEGQTFHENFKKRMTLDSEIPNILKKHKIEVGFILDEDNFPLLEQELPDLCADRIDYFLKDFVNDFGKTDEVNYLLNHIIVAGNKFVMDDRGAAKKFANLFMKMCLESWVDPPTLAAFNLLARAVRKALDTKQISETDLFLTDQVLLNKLKATNDPEILRCLNLSKPSIAITVSDVDYDFHSWGKPRYVDPPVYEGGKLKKLSELDKSYVKKIGDFKKKVLAGHKIKIHGLN